MTRLIARLIRILVEGIFVVFIILDGLARPFYRPLIRWVASWRLAVRFEAWVAARHRLTILVLLAIPFAIAEPMKVLTLIWIGHGAIVTGGLGLVLAYLLSFLLVERIYSAGQTKLLTFGWFARLMAIKAAAVEWLKQSAAWKAAQEAKAAARRWWKELRGAA